MPTDNKFTKGEWMYCKYNNIVVDYGIYSSEVANDIALVRGKENEEETLANVKIMTYAPEMLEILDEINKAAMALADSAPVEYKNERNDLFADIHNAHLHVERLIYKITEE